MFYKRKSIILYDEYEYKTNFANLQKSSHEEEYSSDFDLWDIYKRIK